MNYCSHCGHKIERRIPENDNRERYVCPACQSIHYQNPRMVVGTVVEHEGCILLCKRAIEPRKGYWTLPAGFLENGESMSEGAARETLEEAGAEVGTLTLFSLIDVPYIHQIHAFYRAQFQSLSYAAGPESLEVALLSPAAIPWDEIAFPTVGYTLNWYLQDSARQRFTLHSHSINTRPPLAPAEWKLP